MWWCASWDWSCSGFALWTRPASPRCKNMWQDMQRLWHWGGFWGQAGFKWQIWNLRCMGNAFFSLRCWVSVFWPHAAWYPSPFFWGPMGDHVGYARPTHHSCSLRLSFPSMPWLGAQWTLIIEPVLLVPSLAWVHLFHCRNSATWGGQHHRTPTFLPPMHGALYPWPSHAQRRWSWTCLQILRWGWWAPIARAGLWPGSAGGGVRGWVWGAVGMGQGPYSLQSWQEGWGAVVVSHWPPFFA